MGAIKDVVDLATQLSESVSDRKFANDLFKIIQLINTVQVEQSVFVEKNIQLMTENSELKATVSSLESDVIELQKQISNLQKPTQQPPTALDKDTEQILKLFFDAARALSINEVVSHLGIEPSIVSYHFDQLLEKKFIHQATSEQAVSSWVAAGRGNLSGKPATFAISPNGRKYIIENKIT